MAEERLNKKYRNKHNQREVVCVGVRVSDYGIYTWTLRGEDAFDCEMAEYDMAQHWEEIELIEEFKSHPLAWRRRATPEEVAARKAQKDEERDSECIQEHDWEQKPTKVCGCVECWPESQNFGEEE